MKKQFRRLAGFCLAVMMFGSLNVCAQSSASKELSNLVNENVYLTTLTDGTSTYSTHVQSQVKDISKTVFDNWVNASSEKGDVNLESVIAVPVTGNLAYSELNEPYKKNLAAIKKQYSKKPNVLTYAVRYDFIKAGKTYSAMCFVGKSSTGDPVSTKITIFDPKSDEYITALYTVLYPSVPAMIFSYAD